MVGIRFSRRAIYQRFADMYIAGLPPLRVFACHQTTVTAKIEVV